MNKPSLSLLFLLLWLWPTLLASAQNKPAARRAKATKRSKTRRAKRRRRSTRRRRTTKRWQQEKKRLDNYIKKHTPVTSTTKLSAPRHPTMPKQIGAFPIPRGLESRIRLWFGVFGRFPEDASIIYDNRTFVLLDVVRMPGVRHHPDDSPLVRVANMRRRYKVALKAARGLRPIMKKLATIEQKAENIQRRAWNKKRKHCRSYRYSSLRRRCWRALRFRSAFINRKAWNKRFAALKGRARLVWRRIQNDPRAHQPGWHRLLRKLRNPALAWQSSYSAFFKKGLKVALRYQPHIRRILQEAKLPPELAALPFVESMYNPWVRSFVGALGLWQLMPNTAREVGLYVKPVWQPVWAYPPIDERQDPMLATKAATRFIHLCRHYFKRSWPLAITSYNQGPGRILREARIHRTQHLPTIIARSRTRSFGFDGRNFYAKFLASALLLRHHRRYFPNLPRITPIRYRTLHLPHPLWSHDLTKITGMSQAQLVDYNPMFRKLFSVIPKPLPQHFPLRVPHNKYNKIRLALATLKKNDRSIFRYRTRRRDTLARLARRFFVDVKRLTKHNFPLLAKKKAKAPVKKPKTIVWCGRRKSQRPKGCVPRRKLYRKLGPNKYVQVPASHFATSPAPTRIMRVRSNKPLSFLACLACTTVWHIRRLNPDLKIRRMRAGTRLKVPLCNKYRRRRFRSCSIHDFGGSKRARRMKRRQKSSKRRKRKSRSRAD